MVSEGEIAALFERLWPLHRSITGQGNRDTLAILSEVVPLEVFEIPSGTELFGGWVVPKEWRVNHAYLEGPNGERVLDIRENLLHLLNYSVPFSGVVSRDELDEHLYDRPDLPNAVPYVTSYYKDRWGFCLSYNSRKQLPVGDYRVEISTELFKGSLSLAEFVVPGASTEEIFFSSFICHPMMANNELAGPVVQAVLAREIAKRKKSRYTYRFAWHPETIGAIAYLGLRGAHLREHMAAGFGFCCVGDGRKLTYKRSRRDKSLADRAATAALRTVNGPTEIRPFKPFDGDERQYCSPGFDLPFGSFMHTPPGEYPEYHSSADDLSTVDFVAMARFIDLMLHCCDILEANRPYVRVEPFCEPKLDRFGLWSTLGVGAAGGYEALNYALLWFLNYADGRDLLEISEISGQPVMLLAQAAALCEQCGLVQVKA